MASKFYLKVPGVPGDSTAPGYRGYIELLSAVYSITGVTAYRHYSGFVQSFRPALFRGISVVTKQGLHSGYFQRASATGTKFDTAFVTELKFEKGKLTSTSGHQLAGVSVAFAGTQSRRTPEGRVEVTEMYSLSFDVQPVPGSAEAEEAKQNRDRVARKPTGVR